MNLATILSRMAIQQRLTPIATDPERLVWLQRSIQRFSARTLWLDRWTVILAKSGVAQYWLPVDHLVTTLAYYNGQRLQMCTSFDTELVAPSTPVYYHEDEWSDDASKSLSTAFMTHYALMSDMILQWLARAQASQGRKTITLVAAPTADGSYNVGTPAATGVTVTQPDIRYLPDLQWHAGSWYVPEWYDTGDALGTTWTANTTNNIWLFYKYSDTLPSSITDDTEWNDALGVAYMCGALEHALLSEDDEYDRFRAWLYGQIASFMSATLRGMVINRRLR